MQKIGFIGLGVMGNAMALNLIKAGYTLTVNNRTKAKAANLVEAGATWADTPAACAQGQDVVITIVGYPKDVEQVYFGEAGILAAASNGTHFIDMTTTDPKLSQKIYEEATRKGQFALDAPVSGGDVGAQQGTLSIMVGGDKPAFDACLPILQALGKSVVYTGSAGMGQHTKMANQIAIAGTIAGVCEAIAYGGQNGLDLQNMLQVIAKGAAGSWQMDNNAPRILQQDYAPGFFIKHFIKDLNIALANADAPNAHLDITQAVRDIYEQLAQQGLGDLGTQSLIKYYE